MSDYDIVVVGAGMAGLTAARRAAQGGAKVLLVDRLGVGGQVSSVEGITNAPGHREPIAGFDLGVQLMEEAEAAGAEVVLTQVEAIVPTDDGFSLTGGDEELRSRAVIVAVGSERRILDVPGEAEFEGHGVSRCASCDGPFFRSKRVIVVGGGDSALDEAGILADFADEVVIVHHGSEPSARKQIAAPTIARDNVRLRPGATVTAITGSGKVASVTIRDLATNSESEHEADGVFVYIGLVPNTEWLAALLDLDETGRLEVDESLVTSSPGIFAAGDVRSGSAAMLAESVEDGERAALSALDSLAVARSRGATATP